MSSINKKKKLSKNQDVPIGYYDKVYIKKKVFSQNGTIKNLILFGTNLKININI